MDFCKISCLTCENFEEPFIVILKKLLKNPKVELDLNIMTTNL